MTNTCEKHCEATAFKIVIRGLEGEVARLKERLAQETALQALHNENERLGLYKDAYAEPVAWGVFEGNLHDMFFTQSEAQEMVKLKGTHAEVRPFYTTPPQRTEQNFCSRCGKRTPDLITIHTCTPPMEKNT
jgi:hypothetical protein